MYLDTRFLSQPHNHSSKSANTTESLTCLAKEQWENESEGTRQFFKLQESKAKEQYAQQVAAGEDYEAQGGMSFERERERAEAERMDVDKAENAGESQPAAGGGFTSING